MSTGANKAIARRFREELFNTGKTEICDQICDNQAVIRGHDPLTPDYGAGPQAFKQVVSMYRTAFPDANCTVDETVAEGDKVVTRWTARGTNLGPLGNSAPTGRKVLVTGVDILKIVKGKIVECDMVWDAAGMLQQLDLARSLLASA